MLDDDTLLELTAEVVSAYVSNNPTPAGSLPALIATINASMRGLLGPAPQPASEAPVPAVAVKKSVTRDYIISLEDGRKFKSLKRHLMTQYGLTPDQYRQKWNLPHDYPMVAPGYAATRSALAKTIGLGRKTTAPDVAPAAPVKRGRKPKATA